MKFATPTSDVPSPDFGVRQRVAAFFDATCRVEPKRGRVRALQTSAFTLAEVLAAMLFMAIVIPVAVEALHISTLAGEVAARKSVAARIADRVLNDSLVTTNWSNGAQSGTITEGTLDFKWTMTAGNWPQAPMQLLTAKVTYQAQGRDFSVEMSTLVPVVNATPGQQPPTTLSSQP